MNGNSEVAFVDFPLAKVYSWEKGNERFEENETSENESEESN